MPTPTDADPPNRQAESEAAAGGDAPNPPAAPSPAPRKAARDSAMRKLANRIRRRGRRPVPQSMLPTLIKVYAGFSRVEGDVIEGDIDSALGFLRYDYPEAVYSELRELYRQALSQQQDMAKIAKQLSGKLTLEEKILLGVQLYVLISRSSLHREQLIQFYLFMTNLGVASQAIDIVYQLNAGEDLGAEPPEEIEHPLESLSIGKRPPADVVFETLAEGVSLTAFRFSNLILLKNTGTRSFIARSRQVREDEFCRIYDGQRVILGEQVLDYQDLVFYFNAKKNVSSTLLFLAVQSGGGVAIERARTRQSALQIRFGLGVKVRALQDTPLMLRGRSLRAGASVSAGLYDKLVFPGGAEVSLSDLRRRARELGSRFELPTTRSDYMVSNNPSLLREGDILLSPSARGEVLLRIHCDFDQKRGELEVIQSSRPIYVGDAQIKDRVPLEEGATIRLGEGQFLRCHFGERIIEEERNIISQLEVREVSHSYDGKEPALDAVSFAIQRGEMVCVLGPSGCGKSTLLKAIAGHLRPGGGGVHMNGHDLYAHADNLRPYISFIPHDDAFDPLLTVEENLTWSAAIRCPHFGERERRQRVEAKLTELGLRERRDRLAGTSDNKILSGGERKRLNAGMDMISLADVFLFDEPTSGLSSKDSEHVMEIIRGLAHNKIVIVSIHQPSSRLFHMFHKAILLDRGGKLAFFGKPAEMLEYFRAAHDEQSLPAPEPGAPALDSAQPDYVFDVLETPLRDLGGDILYEDDGSGGVAPARRFSPNFWRDRYQTYRLLQDVRRRGIDTARAEDVTAGTKPLPRAPRRSGRDESTLFSTLLKRAFMSKLRNRGNLATTLLEAPLLAALVATVLRYSEEGAYTFASAFHVPTYLFLSLVIGMFLGLTNSADEIIRDRVLLQRERNHRVRISYYIISKFAALSVFAFLQCVIYLLIGNAILELRGLFWIHLGWMLLTAINGVAIGLFVSSFVSDSKTALNFIPVILIPQIILGGALIKYEEMNRNMDFLYSIRRWVGEGENAGAPIDPPSKLSVPFICEFMPLRWSYESAILAQSELNPLTKNQNQLQNTIQEISKVEQLTPTQEKDLDAAKEALVIISGLEASTPQTLEKLIERINDSLKAGTFNRDRFEPKHRETHVTAEEVFVNQKVLDLVTKAEIERTDYRTDTEERPNVFFGKKKRYFGKEVDTMWVNAGVLGAFLILFLGLLHLSLWLRLSRVK